MPSDPYMSYRFQVEILGIVQAGFSEVSGLQTTTEVETFREGGLNEYVHKFPKETTFQNLTLKRGMGDYTALWEWHQEVRYGIINRLPIIIMMLDERSASLRNLWIFIDAFPVKWSGPEFKSDSNTVAFESLEFAHHGFF